MSHGQWPEDDTYVRCPTIWPRLTPRDPKGTINETTPAPDQGTRVVDYSNKERLNYKRVMTSETEPTAGSLGPHTTETSTRYSAVRPGSGHAQSHTIQGMAGVEDLFEPDPTDPTALRLTRGGQLFEALKGLDNATVAERAINELEPEGLRSIVLAQLYNFQALRTDEGWDNSHRRYDQWCSEDMPPAD